MIHRTIRPSRRALAWTGLFLLGGLLFEARPAAAQSVSTIPGAPAPVDSQEPVVGFRSYDFLAARYQDLFLAHAVVAQEELVGSSFAGRPIRAYLLTGESSRGPDGTLKAPAMIQGQIHAREWISAEVVAQLFEHMVLEYGSDPISTYLVDQLEIVCLPIHNPDGFLQTQRFFNQEVSDGRDGRLRRKNMRNGLSGQVDEVLSTFGDHLRGTDLNRNHQYGFGASSDPDSILYNGISPGSDPESQAMYAAAAMVDSSRIRVYFDVHSFGEDIYYVETGATARDPFAFELADRMSDVYAAIGGNGYSLIPVFVGGEIGATDEYFSNEFGALGMTIELPAGNVDGGFVMGNNQIAAAVEENIEAHLFALYYAAGPPIAERVVLWRDADMDGRVQSAEVAYDSFWPAKASGTERNKATRVNSGLAPGEDYNVWVRFNKPMRRDVIGNGTASKWPGVSAPGEPSFVASIDLSSGGSANVPVSGGTWRGTLADGLTGDNDELFDVAPGYVRYEFDSWTGTLSVPANALVGGGVAFEIEAQDMYGHELDGLPATVADWSSGWTGHEDGASPALPNPSGGSDLTHSTTVASAVPVELSAFGLE